MPSRTNSGKRVKCRYIFACRTTPDTPLTWTLFSLRPWKASSGKHDINIGGVFGEEGN